MTAARCAGLEAKVRPWLLLSIGAVLLIVACGGGSDAAPTSTATTAPAQATPTSPPAATPTPAAGPSLANTPVAAALSVIYKVEGGRSVTPAAAELPVPSGSVEARWYQADGRFVVFYAGLALAEAGPLCPGNSIQTATGFLHITNGPTGAGACTGVQNPAAADEGVRLCGGSVFYVTRIPVDAEGTLYGTIERFLADGTIIGLTSRVAADRDRTPAIDLSGCEAVAS